MDSIVQGLADVYDRFTWVVARGAGWLSVVLLWVAAAAALAMVLDLLITPSRRFKGADRASQPRDGIILIGQIMAGVSLAGGVVLLFRDTASPWQPAAALLGGAALLAILLLYRRAAEQAQAAMARYVWLALAVTAVIAVILAYMQRDDSAIPYMGLLFAVFVIARAWFTLARPEVHFDPSKIEVTRESRTESPLIVQELGMVYELPDGGSVEALKDVTFTLEPGRLLTLLGPSGCGKTTLLNIIAGFLAPTSGVVKLGNDPITGPGQDRGMVFQRGALFEWLSVNDNVGFGARMNGRSRPASREAVQDLLNIVGLQDFGDKAVYELSGGMQQRVALARCLANDPKLILMDEPLGALDALTREKMQSLVLNLWNETGKTIVLVTHSVEEALYLGDQLFVMAPRPGRIERTYDLPFAQEALTADARELKTSAEFIRVREEILTMIWEMEEQIMGTAGGG
ncbi:MAG: ABC transporter ATP-binding protein [Acidimicrobiaceae bacterium]|nr:ABC transporter ATP-binding protein [Acidimicrobiaceae bacterium]